MKSYLSGSPQLCLALNEDLVVGKQGGTTSTHGAVVLDDCNFHECVRLDDFETTKQLSFHPPDGEFICLNYRITTEFRFVQNVIEGCHIIIHFLPDQKEYMMHADALCAFDQKLTSSWACRVPFRLFCTIMEVDENHLELSLLVRADIPEANHGSNIMLRLPVPRSAMSVRAVST